MTEVYCAYPSKSGRKKRNHNKFEKNQSVTQNIFKWLEHYREEVQKERAASYPYLCYEDDKGKTCDVDDACEGEAESAIDDGHVEFQVRVERETVAFDSVDGHRGAKVQLESVILKPTNNVSAMDTFDMFWEKITAGVQLEHVRGCSLTEPPIMGKLLGRETDGK